MIQTTARRRCTTRVRSGCSTCKLRRKKCDGAKPTCGNCTASKRICGYLDPFRNQFQEVGRHDVQLTVLSPRYMESEKDGRHFVVFQRLSTRLLNYLDQDFILGILQRSVSQNTIRHAVLALSPQLEAFAKDQHKNAIDPSQESYALLHHGQSLQLIRRCLENNSSAEGLIEVLFAVFLAIVFEVVRGNDLAALTHLEGALSALDVSTKIVRGSRNTDVGAIKRVFARLEIHALSFAGTRTPSRPNLIPTAISLTAEVDSPDADGQRCAQKALRKFGDHLASLEYQGHQAMRCDHQMIDSLITGLEDWYKHFQPLLCSLEQQKWPSRSNHAPEIRQCHLLHIRYMIMLMRLDAFRQACETAFDAYEDFFDRITTLADGILKADNSKMFTLELELVEPLYFAVLKCRKPETRIKALALLRSSGQEGVWDGPYMAAIAQEVILVEELLFKTHVTAGMSPSHRSRTLAELMWDERENPKAESGRVCAVALIEYNRKSQTALIECSFKSGSVRSVVNSATSHSTDVRIKI